jgi:hypothetical protein
MVMNMHNMMSSMPSQIERQQPVHFLDALGRCYPVHLEFIQCYEVSQVLSVRHKEA